MIPLKSICIAVENMEDETNFLTETQYMKFMNSIPKLPRYHTAHSNARMSAHDIQLLFATIHDGALRVSEALKLTPDDLIIDQKLLKLENTKGTKESKKNQKREFGWVKDNVWDALVKLTSTKKHDERLFKTTRQTVWKWAKDIGAISGIQLLHQNKDTTNMTVHTLRHTRAVSLADKGMPVHILMKKLRHRSMEPTTTYVNVNTKKVREMEDELDRK